MRRIADTNILVRYLTGDDAKAAAKATEIIRNGVEVIPETIPEVLYVLTSKILYAIPRPDAAKAIIALLDDISMLNYNVTGLTMEQRIIKRCMDIGLSLLMGIVTSPIWIVSAIAIKAYDGGSVFFKQDRATINGNIFKVYKFRTMKEHVENRSVSEDDDRITPPGRILRKIRMGKLQCVQRYPASVPDSNRSAEIGQHGSI